MNIANKIDYVAADDKRQTIPYIHVEDQQGESPSITRKIPPLNKDQISKTPASPHGLRRLPQPSDAYLRSSGPVRRSISACSSH